MGKAAADVVMVVVPFPAQGHLNQLLHYCRLVASRGVDVPIHFIGTSVHNRQARTRLHGWNPRSFPNLQFHDFPVPCLPTPPPDPHAAVKFPSHLQPAFDASLLHLRPQVSLLLRSLSANARRVVVVHDSLMSFVAQESASLSNAETYAFHSVSAFANLLFQWESRGMLIDEAKKMLPTTLVFTSDGCFTEEFMQFIRRQHSLTAADDGRIINTCRPIEAKFIDLFAKEPILRNKKLYAIGPLNPLTVGEKVDGMVPRRRHECLRWLDKQPPCSVLYVSFGTTSSMCCRQISELAAGLDRCQQRFVWVLRDADRADIFAGDNNIAGQNREDQKWSTVSALATKGRGIVMRGWAPQLEILGHASVGGFMTHCGWNSCIESLSFGVPMVVWPMHSDQPRNAVMVTDVLRVGIAVREWLRRGEIVSAAMVDSAIRKLMLSCEGKDMRTRATSLGHAIQHSSSEVGSSGKALDDFVSHITRP